MDTNTTDVVSQTLKTTMSTLAPGSNAAILNSAFYRSLSTDGRRRYDYHHQLPGEPSHEAVVSILSLSVLVLVCSSLVLLATRYTSGGQSGTLVFLRSLLLSDILMAVYGVTKMGMLLFLYQLRVNFFLPDSLFFTASLASTSSLLSLNLDCFLKLARPYKYAQVEKHTVITVMLLVWNAAFVVGFLPLVGWNDEAYTFRFFSFYPWHFLLFNGLVVFVCVIICIVCMLSLKKFFTLPETDPSCFSTRTLEVRKYRHLHHTIVMESAMWLACYLPFFVYISLACRQCSLGDYRHSDSTIIYFLPVFLTKSLFSAALQAFRTFHVHTVMNKLITDISNLASPRQHLHPPHHHHNYRDKRNHSVATIAYTNPLSEHHLHHLHDDNHINRHHSQTNHQHDGVDDNQEGSNHFLLDANHWTIHHRRHSQDVTDLLDDGDIDTDNMSATLQLNGYESIMGITNVAFSPSIQLDLQQESTKL